MFIIRKITVKGVEMNISLGESYTLVTEESNKDEFNRLLDLPGYREATGGLAYGFVTNDKGQPTPLYKGQYNYIMTSNGQTFSNISFKMTLEERPALKEPEIPIVKNTSSGLYKLRTEYNESAGDGPYSVYIATDEDPDNAILAGYGFSYFEALENFMKNMEDTSFDFDENLNVIDLNKK